VAAGSTATAAATDADAHRGARQDLTIPSDRA
jgi:hypothetical protein